MNIFPFALIWATSIGSMMSWRRSWATSFSEKADTRSLGGAVVVGLARCSCAAASYLSAELTYRTASANLRLSAGLVILLSSASMSTVPTGLDFSGTSEFGWLVRAGGPRLTSLSMKVATSRWNLFTEVASPGTF